MNNQEDLLRLHEVKKKLEPEILGLENVRGFSIGVKMKHNKPTGNIALVVHVYKKLPLNELSIEANVNQIIQNYDKTLISDVVENEEGYLQYLKVVDEQIELTHDNSKYRPLKGGCRIMVSNSIGTGGCIVHSKVKKHEKSILTCQHVVESPNKEVYQPTIEELNKIGTVEYTVDNPKVDCANVKLKDTESEAKIIEIGSVKGTALPVLNAKVKKRGMTTGLTHGVITNVSYTGKYAGKDVEDQILISKIKDPICGPGDSGSVWLFAEEENNNKVFGLHWAGTNSGSQACACLIGEVENALYVEVSTE